ncbi:sigma-70 family RNA polymerase sigma factor [Nakamurella sp. PAMC28650]|uniref:sigma-70 family RNA polymerase sigma factor n=1 Tax=Nakamurella sp. PAMC28650 TaxID=2762325 RepID=UPI00164ECF72|nr:sigma-70 family RNA polymerase sigma factor [Nakamurella sp. PAMC28650]QNK83154.1 sigma-70 family RNA polymerase sigma factor [Nakamurella sp. PAMC28650]
MPPVEDHAQLASDAELITRVRAGDRSAFGDLYARHAGAALALARQFSRSPTEADDLVSEAFARVLDGMLESKGPDTAFRAYLFTTLRNTAYDRTRKDKRLQFSDDMERHDVAVEGDDPIIADLEKGLIGKAFAGLPERWQTVLWHMQVEGQSAAEVGVLLGMAPNAVSSLAFRAREGLREAYLQAHLAETAAERCRTTVDRLGAWTRGGLSKREKAQVDAHLEECRRCPALAAELSEINTGLRGLLAPLLLGGAAAGYLSTLGPVAPLAQLGVLTGGKVAAVGGKAAVAGGKGIAGHAAAGLAKIGSLGPGAVAAGVAAAAAVAVAAITIALTSGHSAPSTAAAGTSGVSALTSGPVAGPGGTGGGASGGGGTANGGNGGAAVGGTATGGTRTGGTTTGPGATAGSTGPAGAGSGGAGGAGGTGGSGGVGGTGGLPIIVIPATTPTIAITPTVPNTEGNAGATALTGPSGTSPANGSGATPTDSGVTGTSQTSGPSSTPGTSTSTSTSTNTSGTTTPGTTTPSTTGPTTTGPTTTGATTGTTTTSPTTSPTTTSPTTTPPPPPVAIIGVDTRSVSVGVAGGLGVLKLQIANSGDGPSAAGLTMQVNVPPGVTLGQPTLSQALRSSAGAFASRVASDTCAAAGASTMTCTLPPVAAGKSLTLTFIVAADPTAVAKSDIAVSFDGGAATKVPLTVASGYRTVSFSSSNPLGRAATATARLTAVTVDQVTDAGTLSVPLAIAPGMTITGLAPGTPAAKAGTGCSIGTVALICPSGAAIAGVDLVVAVDTTPTPGPDTTAPATDQGGRSLITGSLDVSDSPNGGYTADNPVELDPAGVLAQGTTTSITLLGHPLPGVIDSGPIVVPVDLTQGTGVTIDVTNLPTGCVLTPNASPAGSLVTCTPADNNGSATFPLTVVVAPDATGGTLWPVTLPVGSSPTPGVAGAHTLDIDPMLTGYQGVTARIQGLNAGTDGSLTLVGTVKPGITNPGKVTVPVALGPGVSITASASDNCTVNLVGAVCTPGIGGTTTWKLVVHTASDAKQGTLAFPSLRLAGSAGLIPVTTGSDLTVRALATSCGPAATLLQGDFETPQVSPGAGKFQNSSTTAWNTTEPDQMIEFWRTGAGIARNNGGVDMAAHSGSQWVELNARQASALYQDVRTVPGQQMRWTIWHRARALDGLKADVTIDKMAVQIGASAPYFHPDSNTAVADNAVDWVQHSGVYIVPAGQRSTRFQFVAISTASGDPSVGNFLDDISFSTVPCLTAATSVTNSNPSHATARPGDTLTISTTVTNNGGDAAANVVVTNPAPANTTEVAGSQLPIAASIDPGRSATTSFKVTVDADVPDGTVISDNAALTYVWPPSTDPLGSLSNTVTTTVSATG